MSDPVKPPRRYDNRKRRAAAATTRSAILRAARELFTTRGYVATSMRAIAERADVAVDTVYATVGTKPTLFESLVESALSGREEAVAGADRDYAVQMRAAADARTKLAIYASAVTAIQQRLAPLFLALRSAAGSTPELEALWRRISERRAHNMRLLTDDLAATGELRADLTREEIADVIWVMNSAEHYAMLVLDRRWSPERYEDWLHDAWIRILLDPAATTRRSGSSERELR